MTTDIHFDWKGAKYSFTQALQYWIDEKVDSTDRGTFKGTSARFGRWLVRPLVVSIGVVEIVGRVVYAILNCWRPSHAWKYGLAGAIVTFVGGNRDGSSSCLINSLFLFLMLDIPYRFEKHHACTLFGFGDI